jgi:pimeloyl-ACP methyl ester carboxylesterase
MPGSATLRMESPVELQIPVPWGHISAKAWGNPESKIPVLAVHGWLDNAGTFDRLVPQLSNSLYIVAVDLPGHGLSTHLPAGMPYHFGDFLLTMRRITKFLKWTRFSILGHSMGAGLGVFYSSMFPSSVERLVMLDMIKPMSHDEGTTASSMAQAVDFFLSVEEKVKPELTPSYSFQDALNRMITATDNR